MNLEQKLNYHYKVFNRSQLEPDPLQFPHLFENKNDIEVIAFIASVFAYGSVTQIINTLYKIVDRMDHKPLNFIKKFNIKSDAPIFKGMNHRFYRESDIVHLFKLIQVSLTEYGSLKKLFLNGYNRSDKNVKIGIMNFSRFFLDTHFKNFGNISNGIKFMFPLPEKGSACKRMNLFLRWMVRHDELDFGLWDEIPKNKLVIPVDTHIAKICRQLKLTKRKNISWNMAQEITDKLKKYDPIDPVKYDFALCHIGMRKMKF